MLRRRTAPFIAAVSMAVLFTACDRKTISEINQDPGQFRNKDVNVAGKVITSVGALGQGIYQIDDGTGRLWVLSRGGGVPANDAYVGVKGRVTQGVTVLGRSYGTVLRESERKTEKPKS